ncbi:MAG: NAD(P)-dependent oxidoreductase [Helicobacteraceae bacterium]|nr:NAD(P)-dependent oxidoreductase [Helicobacteraceae bacterium]
MVFHSASPTGLSSVHNKPVDVMTSNIFGAKQILDLLRLHKNSDVFFIPFSSVFVYGNASKGNIDENNYKPFDITSYLSSYISAKIAVETLCAAYSRQFGIKTVFPRFSGAYGPGVETQDTAIGNFFANAMSKQDIIIHNPSDKCDYCYLTDSVIGLFYCIFYGKNAEAYNVANSESFLIRIKLAEIIAKTAKAKVVQVVDLSLKPSVTRGAIFSNKKLKALGWEPKISLRDGVQRTLSYLI